MNNGSNQKAKSPLSRRKFIVKTGMAATAFTIIKPSLIQSSDQNSKLTVGVVGLGGRGSLIAKMLTEHKNYELVAVADYFDEVVQERGQELQVPQKRRYSTLSAYRQLIDSDLDAVFLETPPYCFPVHSSYAIKKGRHVYMAKPVACDVPGCSKILETQKQATSKNLTFLVDFQMPTDPYIREVVKRMRQGDIGKTGLLVTSCGSHGFEDPPKTNTIESRLRELIWVNDTALGCGYLGNYDIHAIDVALWMAGEPPETAAGSSRRVRENAHGDSHDVYSVTYQFKNGLILSHHSEHFPNIISASLDCYAHGTEGYAEARYWGKTWLRSNKNPYRGGMVENLYNDGIRRNLDRFYNEVVRTDASNKTAMPAVNSTLACILGRDAAEQDRALRWNDMLNENRTREVNLEGLKND